MSEIAMQWMRPRFLPEHLEHLNAGRLGRLGTIRLLHLLFVAILFGKYGERERESERERERARERERPPENLKENHFAGSRFPLLCVR
jgi:hypothetical protein